MLNIVFGLISLIFTAIMLIYGIYYAATAMNSYRKIRKIPKAEPQKRIAAIVPARNEAAVIGNLIQSLKDQDYPADLLDIIVIPNNCTDNTQEVAERCGARILPCSVPVKSKGEVLHFAFNHMVNGSMDDYDAFCVFDADNLVHPGFIKSMNDALVDGARIAQGYRDSKNPTDSWISSCHSIYYFSVNGFFNRARMALGWSAALNGTGFMVSREYLQDHGFNTYTMTEDIEYTAQAVADFGERIIWVPDAVTYDEHPLSFKESWTQRRRWTVGTVQCFCRYFKSLLCLGVKDSPSCIDILILFCAPVMQIVGTIPVVALWLNILMMRMNVDSWIMFGVVSLISCIASYLFTMFAAWLIVKSEHKLAKTYWKGILTFGIFIMSWLPIGLISLVKPNCGWKPIKHTRNLDLSDVMGVD